MNKNVQKVTLALGLMFSICVLSEAQSVKKDMVLPFTKVKEANAIHNVKISPRMELKNEFAPVAKAVAVDNNVLPYIQNFNSVKSLTEIGWTKITTNEYSGMLGNFKGVTGADGNAICWNSQKTAKQDEWVITNAFDLEANKKVYIAFDLFMPGASAIGGVDDKMEFAVNTAQASANATVLKTITDKTGMEYTPIEIEFTPTTTGTYYFAWHLCTPSANGNGVGIDNFKARLDGQGFPPVGSIIYHTPHQLCGFVGEEENSKYLVMHNQGTDCYPLWENDNTMKVQWQLDGSALSDMGQYGEVSPVFATTGTHELLLALTNDAELTSTIKMNVDVLTYADAKAKEGIFFSSNETETEDFSGNAWAENDFAVVTGFNEKTNKLAQKFDLPVGVSMSVNGFILPINYCTIDKLTNVAIGFKFLGVTADGFPDESKVLGEGSIGTFGDINNFMEQNQTTLVPVNISSAINISGPFFFVLEADIPSGFVCSQNDYFGLVAYVEHIFEGSSPFYLTINNKWASIDEISQSGAVGASLWICLQATLGYDPTSIDAISNALSSVFIAGNELNIQNIESESVISIYTIDGKLVLSSVYTGENISVATLANGIYVVKVGEKSFKVVK